jgi:hypothetical protein
MLQASPITPTTSAVVIGHRNSSDAPSVIAAVIAAVIAIVIAAVIAIVIAIVIAMS